MAGRAGETERAMQLPGTLEGGISITRGLVPGLGRLKKIIALEN